MKKVFRNPSDDELSLKGEFLSLKVHYSSFTVKFQVVMETNIESQHIVRKHIYPLSSLKDFFRVNSQLDGVFCRRSMKAAWNMV
jgi:hypothetical protein